MAYRLRWLMMAAIALAAGVLSRPLPAAATPAEQPPTQVRVAHAAPDAPPVDVFIDGELALSSVDFGTVSGYVPVIPGSHALAARAEGAPPDVTVFNAQVAFAPGVLYTVLALPEPPGGEPIVLEDTPVGPPATAQVRFVHASPNGPPVDIAAPGALPLFPNVAFGTVTPYADVQPGTLTIEARLAGTPQPVLEQPGLVFAPGGVYTLVAIGLVGGVPPLGIMTIPGS